MFEKQHNGQDKKQFDIVFQALILLSVMAVLRRQKLRNAKRQANKSAVPKSRARRPKPVVVHHQMKRPARVGARFYELFVLCAFCCARPCDVPDVIASFFR